MEINSQKAYNPNEYNISGGYMYRVKLLAFILFVVLLTIFVFAHRKEPLSSWEDTNNKKAILAYVEDVTASYSKNFIPKEDRIAVFDMDGTCYCERGDYLPAYFARYMANYRLKHEDNFYPNVELQRAIEDGFFTQDQQIEIFSGMTNKEVKVAAKRFIRSQHECFNNLTYRDAFYTPMIELVKYLKANGFTVYIVSGTDKDIMGDMIWETLGIPLEHIIASPVTVQLTALGRIERTSEYTVNDGFTKVQNMINVIGKKPVFGGGNSKGDFPMLDYVKSNEEYKTFCMLVSHDDDKREFVYPNEDDKRLLDETSQNRGYYQVSMKDEFKEVFKGEVTKKEPSEFRMYQMN